MAECHICGEETDNFYECSDCGEITCQSASCGDCDLCNLCLGDLPFLGDILDLEDGF